MNTNHPGIAGKVVIVTGASSGLGEATARRLAAAGATVVLSARRADRLAALVAEIEAAGGTALAVATDVAKKADVDALVAKTVATYGRLDVLVNNAGLMQLAPLEMGRTDEWDAMIDINVKGVLYGIAAALPVMKAQGSGHIVNVASVGGIKVFTPIGTVDSATKFAVRAISEGLRSEAPAGVRTTIVSPGAVASELKDHTRHAETANAVRDWYDHNEIPSDSVARAIAYAIEQPADVDVNEIVLRPVVQEF